MLLTYINRKKKSHFLKVVLTKKGKKRYYIVKDKSKYKASELVSELPDGFEFYENPDDARVSFRKKLKSIITNDEMNIIDTVMKNHETVDDFLLDKVSNGIIIYTAHLNRKTFGKDFHSNKGLSEDHFLQIQSYNYKLRFEKTTVGTYKAQRFCHLSRYYGWITLETNNNLSYLAEKYCYHIDKESLVQFWIEGEEDW